MRDEEFLQHLGNISEAIDDRLQRQGLPVLRYPPHLLKIVHEEMVSYWKVVMEAESMRETLKLEAIRVFIEAHGTPTFEEDGFINLTGVVDMQEQALYVEDHKITVDPDGKVIAVHGDGSLCDLACPHCDEPDIFVLGLPDAAYATCKTCGARTDLVDDQYQAIGSWLVGKSKLQDKEA